MLELHQQNYFFLLNFNEEQAHQAYFFDVNFWQQQNRIIGSAKGRGTTWFLQTKDLFGVNSALRHYYRGGLLGKINKDRYCFTTIQKTRSFAEFRLLSQLYEAGLPVPKPIGAKIEKLAFGQYCADILTEKIENAQDLTALLQHTTLDQFGWQQIGKLIRQLHDLQVYHTDLNAHNILVQHMDTEPKYWLLDFDKCGYKSGNFWKTGNLQRLYRSFMKEVKRMNIGFIEQNWQDLLNGYYQDGD